MTNNCAFFKMIFMYIITSNLNTFNCDNFFVAKRNRDSHYYCITNSTYGLSLISANMKEVNNTTQVSVFIPKGNQNNFDWDISGTEAKTKDFLNNNTNWLLKNSLDSNLNDIIWDRRWEEMTIQKTQIELNHTVAVANLKSDFVIPFSIYVEKNAQIYFCNDSNVSNSSCYEFRLHNWKIEVIKHKRNTSSTQKLEFPNNSHFYYSSLTWIHFKFKKEGNNLSLNADTLVLPKGKNEINITHMIIASTNTTLWKIHKLDFIYTDKSDEKLKLNPAINVVDGWVCISMFIWICPYCKLQLILKDRYSSVIGKKEYKSEHDGWTEIKFIKENIIKTDQVFLWIFTNGKKDGHDFWAIDKIRLCQKKEFRMVVGTTSYKCQLITNKIEDALYPFEDEIDEVDEENKCAENEIAKSCVPCTWLPYQNCSEIKICEKEGSLEPKCSCSAGYYHEGNCTKKCDVGTFGYGCKKECGKCFNNKNCDNVDGTCFNCTKFVMGKRCDILPEIVFEEAPKIINISYTNVTLQMINFSILQKNSTDQPKNYMIQYKESNSSNEWSSNVPPTEVGKRPLITINDLKVDTEYIVRSILVSLNGLEFTTGAIKSVTFKTKCDLNLTIDEVGNSLLNTSVNITVLVTDSTCKQNNYEVSLHSKENQVYTPTSIKKNEIYFSNLTPYTVYKIYAKDKIKGEFRTAEGVPGEIQNFRAHLSDENVTFTWDQPLRMNGEFINYVVYCELLTDEDCDQNKFHKEVVKNNAVIIKGPYRIFLFTIVAVNNKFEGKPYKWSADKNHDEKSIQGINISSETQTIILNTCDKFPISAPVDGKTDMNLFPLLLLFLLIPVGIFIFKKHQSIKKYLCTSQDDHLRNQQELQPLATVIENKNNIQVQNEKSTLVANSQVVNDENNRDREYILVSEKTNLTQIPVEEFKEYVEECMKNGEFERQYNMVLKSPSRLIYERIDRNQYFDYVDMTFLDGEEIPRAYIAAEMPKPDGIADFWKMVWEEHVEHIVFLTEYENTEEKYWPEENVKIECHKVMVQLILSKILEHYEIRKFILIYGDEIRNVDQLLLRMEHNEDIVLYSQKLLPFFQKNLRNYLKANSPILVHSSDGIEKTGFVILCDMCLRISKMDQKIDVMKSLQKISDCNVAMIKNFFYYYILTHLIILEYHFGI